MAESDPHVGPLVLHLGVVEGQEPDGSLHPPGQGVQVGVEGRLVLVLPVDRRGLGGPPAPGLLLDDGLDLLTPADPHLGPDLQAHALVGLVVESLTLHDGLHQYGTPEPHGGHKCRALVLLLDPEVGHLVRGEAPGHPDTPLPAAEHELQGHAPGDDPLEDAGLDQLTLQVLVQHGEAEGLNAVVLLVHFDLLGPKAFVWGGNAPRNEC